ncbi:MAG TPA: hypothetical protein CFH84_11845 [Sulfurimonas sp. UBA12504]|nr:MAG: hypothetical protein A2019_08970 [Sulfurimonas sp. GWF2_37_8]DAB29034.1 MAG TPA: hypothetical protein CFH84_11845 [Sulfurimonas sp. UBA12504]
MNLSYLTSFFKQKSKTLTLPDSILMKKLKSVTEENNLLFYQNITIYHHAKNFFIPLLMFDSKRGLYLFEDKTWNFEELKNAKIERAKRQNISDSSLAFENSHEIIKQRLKEIIHNAELPIYNYALMENLRSEEYQHLDVSFEELLPKSRVLFADSSTLDIVQKLQEGIQESNAFPDAVTVIGSILMQYCILQQNQLHLCTHEQMNFIDAQLQGLSTLKGDSGSGKTNILALKAIVEKLKNSANKIIIIQKTNLACEILKRKLLEIVEHAIVEADITSIEVITPIELVNKHLSKLRKTQRVNTLYIEEILLKKSFDAADIILCDNADFYEDNFIAYLKHIQKNAALLLVSSKYFDKVYNFTANFKLPNQKAYFYKTNPHAKALQIIAELLKENSAHDIVVISNTLSQEKLNDDLKYFIRDKAVLLDSSKNLIEIDLNNLTLANYEDIDALHAKFVILMDITETQENKRNYALYLAYDSTYILYEKDCEIIEDIRKEYESSKERTRVEEPAKS